MKAKKIILLLTLAFSLFSASAKIEFKVVTQNTTLDSSTLYSYYLHINGGNTMMATGVMHIVEIFGFYDGPADSVHWFLNGNPAGVTYGADTISFNQPGTYTATGYYAGIWPTQKSIVLTVLTAAGIRENNDVLFSVTRDELNHSLLISIPAPGKNALVQIYSLEGKLVNKTDVPDNVKLFSFSPGTIREGIYFITLITEEKRFTKKMLIQE